MTTWEVAARSSMVLAVILAILVLAIDEPPFLRRIPAFERSLP